MGFLRRVFGGGAPPPPEVARTYAGLVAVELPPAPPPLTGPDALPLTERPYESTACPGCGYQFEPPPRAKRRCPACSIAVHVRSGPQKRYLVLEDQIAAVAALWAIPQAAIEAHDEAQAAWVEECRRRGIFCSEDYVLDIVGESHYQDTLKQLAATHGEAPLLAHLVPEPFNPYDRHAVAVVIDGQRVGYISRDQAAEYQPVLTNLARRGSPLVAVADLKGGFVTSTGQIASFGVELRMTEPDMLKEEQRTPAYRPSSEPGSAP